ncbi:MAG: porin [Methylophaga sp.]|nr:porin [Methylophaga sp.]
MNNYTLKTLTSAVTLCLLMQPLAYAGSTLGDALSYKSEDKNFTIKVGGRIMVDATSYDEDITPLNGGSEIRRLRLKVSGSVFKDWRYGYSYDAASNKDFRIKGAYLGYNGFDRWRLKVGNLQQPFSLEELTSSKHITFMERSLANLFAPSYTLGATANTWGTNWSTTVGIFGDTIAERNQNNDGSRGIAGRVTYTPIKSDDLLVHLGISTVQQNIDSNQIIRFNTRPESHYTDSKLLSTGALGDIDSKSLYGLEAAIVNGPWSVQGEYMTAKLDRNNNTDADFNGWYVQGSWFATGEKRRYSSKSGAFTSVKPKSKYGAIELALRYSELDLENAGVTGGEENNTTIGVNWYVTRYIRVMANYIDVNAEPNRNGRNEDADVLQARIQAWF